MQESQARLHGWRRRGRMAGGGGLLAVVFWGVRERVEALGWGLDEKQLPQDGGVWIFFFFCLWRVGGVV